MDNRLFETYFKKTIWKEGRSIPSDAELSEMENGCIEKLIELSRTNKEEYNYAFSYYKNEIIRRIRFFKKHPLLSENKDIQRLLFSSERFNRKFEALDRTRHETHLRTGIEHLIDKPQPNKVLEKKDFEVRHFNSLKLKDEDAPALYDKLVDGGYLEDTGKDDFVYYFTGKGKKAQKKLKWRGDERPYVILSVLLEQLCPPKKIDWETAYSVFEKLPSAMKITLKKTYDRYKDECKQYNNNPQKIKSAYKKHLKLVMSWLTPVEK